MSEIGERLNFNRKVVRASALATALLLTACSGGSDNDQAEKPGVLECKAEEAQAWQPIPSNVKADKIAKNLGVPENEVRSGKLGVALCDLGLTTTEIEGGTIMVVEGVGQPCQAIGIDDPSPPKTGQEYHKILAVCVTETGPITD